MLPERLEYRCDLEGLLVASSGFRAGLVLGRPSKSECGIMTSRALTTSPIREYRGSITPSLSRRLPAPGWSRLLSVVIH